MANIAQRVELKMLTDKLAEIQKKIYDIKSNCRHIIELKFDQAWCGDCNQYFGWWCPDSPDNTCYYHTYEVDAYLLTSRMVTLIDGTEHILRDYEGDPKYESDDDCVFCHDPEERK